MKLFRDNYSFIRNKYIKYSDTTEKQDHFICLFSICGNAKSPENYLYSGLFQQFTKTKVVFRKFFKPDNLQDFPSAFSL